MSTRGRPPRKRTPPRGSGPSTSQRAQAVAGNRVVRQVTYWSVVAVGVLLLALWVVSGPVCGISTVTVKGYTGPDAAAVQQTADAVAGTGSMVRLPIGDMRLALTRFPGIEDVDIQRDWPRSITVSVTMGDPVAILQVEGGGRYLLSPSGRVMGPAKGVAGLPVIRVKALPAGGLITEPGQRAALLFIGWLPPEIAGRLRNLRYQGGRLFADLSNGLELRIGPPDQLAEKAQALVAVLSQAAPEALAKAAYLDISNPRRPMLGSQVVTVPTPGTVTTVGTVTTPGTVPGVDGQGDSGASTDGTDTTLNP